jgi:hypothetical protein
MARGQVTEEELASGLKGIGDFSVLGGVPRIRRDNPFRDSRAEAPVAEVVKTMDVAVPAQPPTAPPVESPDVPQRKHATPVPREIEALRRPSAQQTIARKAERKGRADTLPDARATARKADVFTERITLQISPEMRDEVDALARDLQRAKTEKGERITANTVMRVAVQLLIKHFRHERGEVVNSEDELYRMVEQKLRFK